MNKMQNLAELVEKSELEVLIKENLLENIGGLIGRLFSEILLFRSIQYVFGF